MSRIPALAVLAVGLVAGPAAAEPGETPEAARVYTNDDLRQFGPPSPASPPATADEVYRQWDFVRDFLERELDRVDSGRRLDRPAPPAVDCGPRGRPYPGYLVAPFAGLGLRSRPDPAPRARFDRRVARHGYFIPKDQVAHAGRGNGRHRGGAGAGRRRGR